MKRFLWRWLPPLAWMALIFALSAQPTLPSAPAPLDVLLERVFHALTFGILGWLYLRGLRGRIEPEIPLRVVSWGLAFMYALSDEYHQTFVPGRSGTLTDLVVDALGAAGAMLLNWWQARRRACSGRAS